MTDEPNLQLDRYLADDRLTAEQKARLARARQSLADAGFYAYGMLDDRQRWVVAIDDELGQADVGLEDDAYVIELRGVSPGLFSEEESEWRRRALERLDHVVQCPLLAAEGVRARRVTGNPCGP